jgi:hypothetical protein
VNEILTPGGMVNIKGSRIRIGGDNPDVGLFLINQDTQQKVQIPASAIGMNAPSKVMFVAPADLAAGSYLMSIVTQVAGNTTKRLKAPRTVMFNHILTVE